MNDARFPLMKSNAAAALLLTIIVVKGLLL